MIEKITGRYWEKGNTSPCQQSLNAATERAIRYDYRLPPIGHFSFARLTSVTNIFKARMMFKKGEH